MPCFLPWRHGRGWWFVPSMTTRHSVWQPLYSSDTITYLAMTKYLPLVYGYGNSSLGRQAWEELFAVDLKRQAFSDIDNILIVLLWSISESHEFVRWQRHFLRITHFLSENVKFRSCLSYCIILDDRTIPPHIIDKPYYAIDMPYYWACNKMIIKLAILHWILFVIDHCWVKELLSSE